MKLTEQLQETLAQRHEPKQEVFTLVLGDGRGHVTEDEHGNPLPDRIHLARLLQENNREKIVRCLNTQTAPIEGLIVEARKLKYPTYRAAYVVLGLSERLPQQGTDPYLPLHHESHEARPGQFGRDVVWLYKQAWVELRPAPTDPPSMQLLVEAFRYRYNGEPKVWPGGLSPQFTAPAEGQRWGVLYLDAATATLGIEYGPIGYGALLPPAPTITEGCIPVCRVLLRADTEAITGDVIEDEREFINVTSGGGPVPPSPPTPTGVEMAVCGLPI